MIQKRGSFIVSLIIVLFLVGTVLSEEQIPDPSGGDAPSFVLGSAEKLTIT